MTGVLIRRRDGETDTHKDHMKTEREDSHLQAEESDFRRNQSCQHMVCRLVASGIIRK